MSEAALDLETCDRCPRCGAELWLGYGLAGGGFGPYSSCTSDDCDYFAKSQECVVCETVDCTEHAP